jgi:hypothetical protein
MVLVSFMLLYQDRMFALLNVFALHAIVLSASVAWQAYIQDARIFTFQPQSRWCSRALSFRSPCAGS